MTASSNHSPVGIDYSNLPKPSLLDNGEALLTPYVFIGGHAIWNNSEASLNENSTVRRFGVHVSALPGQFNSENALINLDSVQLNGNAPLNQMGVNSAPINGGNSAPFYGGLGGGVNESPTPAKGLPIQFRKIYFRGKSVDPIKGNIIDYSEKTFSAYFACSLPVDQTVVVPENEFGIGNDPPGTTYNSRNDNYAHAHGVLTDWEAFDIGGGSGAGCGLPYSGFSGNGFITGSSGSGCRDFTFSGFEWN